MSKSKQAALQREQEMQNIPIGLHRRKCRCSRCSRCSRCYEMRTRSIESFNTWIGVLFDEVKRTED